MQSAAPPTGPEPEASPSVAAQQASDRAVTQSMWRAASRFSYVGIFFGMAVVIGWLGGSWLERRLGGAPWVSLAGVLFGVAAGFRELYRIARFVSRHAAGRGDD